MIIDLELKCKTDPLDNLKISVQTLGPYSSVMNTKVKLLKARTKKERDIQKVFDLHRNKEYYIDIILDRIIYHPISKSYNLDISVRR